MQYFKVHFDNNSSVDITEKSIDDLLESINDKKHKYYKHTILQLYKHPDDYTIYINKHKILYITPETQD